MDSKDIYSNNIVSIIAWAFLPTLVGYTQSTLYGIFIRAGDPKPQPGSERYVRHRRRIHILVLVIYVLFNIYEADWKLRQKGDIYRDLGISHDVGDRKIQSRFRQLSLQFHPDKVAPAQREAADAHFVKIKLARDTLLDPVKRFAYDRFGPDIFSPDWKRFITYGDFINQGVTQAMITYAVMLFFVIGFKMLGKFEYGFFWRMISIFALMATEAHIMMNPYFPKFLSWAVNPVYVYLDKVPALLPFQFISILRKAAFALLIAGSQAQGIPQLPSKQGVVTKQAENQEQQHQQLNRLAQWSSHLDIEMRRLLSLEGAPFKGRGSEQKKLRGGVKHWIVQNSIRNEPEVRDLVGRELQKRREGAPAGARGTR